ncbi:ABC transporter permease [Bacillus sp. FJAT-49705]|uniref:ABC transporter permease n=1 Tax=Cytobacillus citreus TaxID=2833586 RepID=A0ABS5NRW5_9BACI|nr:ABC transporter permease [Cytobacillus citreus]
MHKLIRLELEKFKLSGYVWRALIANFVIFGLICVISFIEKIEGAEVFQDRYMALQIIETMIRATFIIFAGVLLSRIVISEFKNKSISVLFMYPINRKKLIVAKLLIVVAFTFICIILSYFLVGSSFYVFDRFAHVVPDSLPFADVLSYFSIVLMNALAASCMSLIPLYFGMKKFSGSTTIVASIITVLIVCQNVGGFTLNSIIFIPISLSLLGVFIAYSAIKNIENIDVIN